MIFLLLFWGGFFGGFFLYFPPNLSDPLSCIFFFLVARPRQVSPCVFIIADVVELLDRLL